MLEISRGAKVKKQSSIFLNGYTNVLAEQNYNSIIKPTFYKKNSEFIKRSLAWRKEEGLEKCEESKRNDDVIRLSAFSLRNVEKALPTLLYS